MHLGFEVRVEFTLADGETLGAAHQGEADQLELDAARSCTCARMHGPERTFDGRLAGAAHASGSLVISSDHRRGSSPLAMSAIVVSSSTARRFARTATHSFPQRLRGARVLHVLRRLAAHARERALDRADHVGDLDLVRRARQPVAALGAALAAHDPGVLELAEDVLQELERDALGLRERSPLIGPSPAAASSAAARTA